MFLYKTYLNNTLYFTERSFKFEIDDSPLCFLCELHNKSGAHLFSKCGVTLGL